MRYRPVDPDVRRPKALGAYIFAGGFTLGVKRHFDVVAHLEESEYGVATMRLNQPEIPVHVGVDRWPIAALRALDLDFVYGNPPCAAWSNAGAATKKGRTYDSSPLVACTERHFGLLEQLRPRVWAWESVRRAWEIGEDFVRRLAERARDAGYSTTIFLHDAQYLGVPQRRRRMLMICHRVEGRLELPDFTVTTTLDEALRGLNDPGAPLEHNIGKHRAILDRVLPGENLSSAFMRLTPPEAIALNPRGQVAGRPPFTIKRARSGEPAPVVMHELIHPTEPRGLSIKELAILCGYPRDYEFVGAKDAGQVGRGVCPPVGEHLARSVARAIAAKVAVTTPVLTLVDHAAPPGRVERLAWSVSQGDLGLGEDVRQVNRGVNRDGNRGAANYPPRLDPSLGQRGIPLLAPSGIKSLITHDNLPEPPRDQASFVETSRGTPEIAPLMNLHEDENKVVSTSARVTVATAASSRPLDGEGSGRYIRRLLRAGLGGDEILDLVHAHYPDSKAGKSDVAWNRARIRKEDAERASLAVVEPHTPQPQATRQGVDPEREFDRSSLRAGSHGQWVHRDYGAHFFRWGFAGRFVTGETDVLDVGCGPDVQMINALTMPRNQVPRSYVGVDLNREPRKHPTRQWATLRWEFNVLERGYELDQFDLVTCFEVIEHMRKADGQRLLEVLRRRLRPSATLLLSTPVFNGKAAANHLHEWQVEELGEAIAAAGLRVERRHGTFASQQEIQRVATVAELEIVGKLSGYYSGEVLSCFLAPIYPDASRNNVWVLKKQ